ncbi:toll/interleukin-1 receptor domain-containing protein [Aequorivita antarctica]|uniref:Toll/interleukin-1 receptor domain-containing protein n=1 Tax=Aequorivita antarctica TaxID=153266 RepID=A0A5C6Z458_9FLAO|nr:toll/interleukin-1 receptor domain-containing protein [Aequorivita antarctica]TXD74326.1 toll/interleukin-1 receptor domain-containing protein [Aequorivita antarctica]SRX73672.1 hypothetical protein AEQU3_01104 [Aequorivita antarctica]
MALIPGYEYDIFISYAHVDNLAFPGQLEGWIKQFYQNLNVMLAKRFGRMDMVKIWWDSKKLDGSVLFDDSIEEGIKKSAIMICLNSPGYIQSPYCKQELDIFYKKSQSEKAGLKIANRSRIINVLLNNIPFSQWPEELAGTSGFPFHNSKESEDFGNTLEIISPEFMIEMQKLKEALWNILTDFQKNSNDAFEPEKIVSADGSDVFKVYLADVVDTLRTPRKRIVAELEKEGCQILDGIPPPYEEAAHEKTTKDAIAKSDLAVHLLDQYPGREIDGLSDIWYPQKQAEICLNTDKSQMIWVPQDLNSDEIEEENYKTFLNEVEAGKVSKKGYEFIRSSKCTIAKEIIDFAEQLKIKKAQEKHDIKTLSVLLDTHLNDQMYALNLSKTLLENQIQPFINPQEDDPRKNINMLGDRMSQVRKLIFLYGNVSKEWMTERMSAALQLVITNNYPIDDFFVYMAPPHKEATDIVLKQRFLKINIVDSSNSKIMEGDVIQKFLTSLKAGAA